jgi:hypothetical protein
MALFFNFPRVCTAITLLTEEQALKEVFFADAEIETETQALAGEK